ncbi:hypothetical protein A6S26_32520 [Nostoc sp. ATCC 43529]|nr:hypothetical protein A6S26_32520 [Nostoc sp. ATCC 43529]
MTNADPNKGQTALSVKMNFDSVIVTQSISIHQFFLMCFSQKLTDVLESIDIKSDLAILMLANLQNSEVAV